MVSSGDGGRSSHTSTTALRARRSCEQGGPRPCGWQSLVGPERDGLGELGEGELLPEPRGLGVASAQLLQRKLELRPQARRQQRVRAAGLHLNGRFARVLPTGPIATPSEQPEPY